MVGLLLKILCLKINFFLCSLLHGPEGALESESPMLISNEAQYDGKEIILKGKVVINHHLGQISAGSLTLSPSPCLERKNKFTMLKIKDDIQVELTGGGRLCCQQAEVDYVKMLGIFLGNEAEPDVTYLNTQEKHNTKVPLEVKSQRMNLQFIRETASDTEKTLVKQIEAIQNVRVNYNHDYLLLADHAVYEHFPTSPASEGLLTLSVGAHRSFCEMTNRNEDKLQALSIQLDTKKQKLWLEQPNGTLYIRREKVPVQILKFKAKELTWDDQSQTLQLKGKVNVTQNETVQVEADKEILIIQSQLNDKKDLHSIQAPEKTQVSYLDLEQGNTHKIYCPGPLNIDHELRNMTMEGVAIHDEEKREQVCIEDVLGEMYADKVTMTYTWSDRHLVPEKINLEGHVRLLNRFDGHPEESGGLLHYALAERVEYFPKQQDMVLSSKENDRVIFYDKVKNVQMSAPSLKMHYDVTTQKYSIQGMGDVRFTFIEKELEQIKQRLRLEETFQKEMKK